MHKWKVGVVGTGYWSVHHLNAWSRIPNVEVSALCNRSSEKMLRRGEQFNVPIGRQFHNVDEMLGVADIDIVDIITGPDSHLEMVRAAAAAGKHIMCQKPFAPSLDEAIQIVQTARSSSVRLMVTENWRWLQPFQIIKRIIDEGTLGTIRVARYIHTDFYTPRMAPGVDLPQPFFRNMPKLLFYEMGVHWFDTWRFLFGTPNRLFAETSTISPYVVGEDTGIVVLGYDSGFYGFLDMSWATRQKLDTPLGNEVRPVHLEQLIIDGDDATLKLYTNGRIAIVSKDGLMEKTIMESTKLDHGESHYRLQSHFIDCLENDIPFQTSGEDNLITLQMAFGVYESVAKHNPVQIINNYAEFTGLSDK